MSAAQNAADAVQHLIDATNQHGLGSPEADLAAVIANDRVDEAHAAGATNDDINAARGR
ncbi:hypothetical protein [Streptomyces sp. Ac-502]|uniref:hypothetical protein n=1 Tax=Streptomyces sp. Ac-502 TaxID=3342801 RepID=UPI003862A16C